ncbi:MAG TPA: error-prone DNA polymerase [Xanthomonadaceae bacterium]
MSSPPRSPPEDPPPYAELHCLSNFSFQRGASHAEELFERARKLGYSALAITDECSLAGIVRAWIGAKHENLKLVTGSEFTLVDGLKCVLLCIDRTGYATLCRLITQARRAAPKGDYRLTRADVEALACDGLFALWIPGAHERHDDELAWLHARFGERLRIALELHREPGDDAHLRDLQELSQRSGIPLVAAGDVHMHARGRRALQDMLTAIRMRRTVADCGHALFANGERHLRTRVALAALYPREALEESARIAERCSFDLKELHYEYPEELVPAGRTPTSHLRALTESGARRRWPGGLPIDVHATIEKELALIAKKKYEAFFLTVEDIVRWARDHEILCQGRGSAANSVVCYCLGITSVSPEDAHLLFERFISEQRDEAPDIDVDFEHERREEVMQYVYRKYGRERAALAATVICYRPRSAVRDVARALGFDSDQLDALSGAFNWAHGEVDVGTRVHEAGLDPGSPAVRRVLELARTLWGFPRHLSQHVGGFVISGAPLWELVPVENASMADRTVIQWDKDDLETLGLLKVDCLALGMLTCIRKCFDLLRRHRGMDLELATIPREDQATYAMIQRADTVGVFQIESRAQMSMLPRLRPANFYDLVIEVAIVRPGPIQGGMVHPYLRRREVERERIAQGLPAIDEDGADFRATYHSADMIPVLGRTCGVPIFQEQVMHLLQVAADFSGDEADLLRRSMAAWKRGGGLEHFRGKIVERMTANGYPLDYIERIIEQIKGFGSYGFPESHAASFALLAYVSSWLKCHQPTAFACALLNSLPMGFYGPAQIVADLRRHGVEVRPVDAIASDRDCTLESDTDATLCLRLGLRQIAGFPMEVADRLVKARNEAPFRDVADLVARARLDMRSARLLGAADALRSLSGHRHHAYWDIAGSDAREDALRAARIAEDAATLRAPTAHEDTFADYASTGLTLGVHPLALIREQLRARRMRRADQLAQARDGAWVRYAGLVTVRQRPGTASGVTFVTLEDESGTVNAIVWQHVALRHRRELLGSRVLGIEGRLQRQHDVQHLVAERLHDLSGLLQGIATSSRDFH